MTSVVLDTSVIIKWFKSDNEPGLAEAHALKVGFQQGIFQVHAPDLLLYEFGNALRFHAKLSPAAAKAKIGALWSTGLQIELLSSDTAGEAMALAYEYDVTFYDSCFLALAKHRQCDFITADKRFYDKVKKLPFAHLL